ncbi:14772_t:CDS:2, partial [Racocetra fulgida]
SIFDSILKPADVSYDYPSIKIINKDADILLQGIAIQTIVIESPLRSKEVTERISALKTRKTVERKVERSKIAALNFYKLGLSHLGVVNPQQEQIDVAVQTAGKELQNLDRMKAPYEKLDIIFSSSNESNDTTNTAQDAPTVPLPNILPQTSDSSAQIPAPIPSPTSLTSSAPSSPKSPTFPSEERTNNPNADAIFPLLIYIVVKSNPKQLISNLRVGQEIVGVADSGLKVITGVVDTSYKMIGRVFGYNENSTANATSTSTVDIEKEHNVIPSTANSMTHSKDISGINTDPPAKIIEKELAEISPDKHNFEKNKTGGNSQIDEPKSLTERLLPFNILPRFSSGGTYPEEEHKEHKDDKENIKEIKVESQENKGASDQHLRKIAPPIKRFLDCPDDEFRAKDVQELLSDYKRLSAAIQELGLFSS